MLSVPKVKTLSKERRRVRQMLVELSYLFFSLLLVIYCAWRFFKRKGKIMLHFLLSLIFLASSLSVQAAISITPIYGTQPLVIVRLIELSGLALFAGFTIFLVLALGKISKT
jgi:heme A synthase